MYQNGPTEGFWPVCPILPEHWGASEGAVLQPILIEDFLPGETTSPTPELYKGCLTLESWVDFSVVLGA